jgi:hypothetical protein
MKDIMLTDKYRLSADTLNFIVDERYEKQESPEHLRKDDYVFIPGYAYRNAKYFSLTYAGLAVALEHATLQTVTGASDAETLADFIADIRVTSNAILGDVIADKLAEIKRAVSV